jgi:glycosyltransferase involved in cell wall biosynthesis
LALGFQKRGHTVYIITARRQGTERDQTIEGIRVFRIGNFPAIQKSNRLSSGSTPMKPSKKVVNEFEELLRQISPDVIHFHNIWLLGPDLLRVCGYRKGVTFHDYWPFCLRRSLMRINEKPCPGPGRISCRLCQLRAPANLEGLDILHTDHRQSETLTSLSTCDFFTAPSQFASQQISLFSGLNVRILHNSISPVNIIRKQQFENPYVLFASRATRIKGLNLILKAFSRTDLNPYYLKIACDIPTLNIPNVEVLGWQNPENIAKLISEAACVVVPSLWPENSPMLILEALHYGTPVIASRIGGIPELILDGETGILIQPGDLEGLVTAIKQCHKDKTLQQEAHVLGPKFILDHFSPESILSEWEQLYAS